MLSITKKLGNASALASQRFFSTSNIILAKKKTSKKDEPEKAFLGRPSNNLSMGVVGLPNIG